MTPSVEETLFIRHFGIGSEQFARELEAEFDQATPEQRAELEKLVDQANAVLPDMHATLDRMCETLIDMSGTIGEIEKGMAALDVRVANVEDRLRSAVAVEERA